MASILVVDDDDVVRQLACRILASNGYTVLDAHSGVNALFICEQHQGSIALLLSSMEMPDMSGRELGKLAKASQPNMAVLLMVGSRESADSEDVVRKPFTSTDLIERVRQTLGEAPTG